MMKFLSTTQRAVVCFSWFPALVFLLLLPLKAISDDTPFQPQPIQFCRQDDALSLDFCMAVTPYRNETSSSTDLYITVAWNQIASNGWLGIGLGSAMTGALMFLLHDDPQDPNLAMVTSIHTAGGHRQPTEFAVADFDNGQAFPDIRVVRSSYEENGAADPSGAPPSSPSEPRTGTSNILIYSSPLWPRTKIDPSSPFQPWIWAHNPTSAVSSSDGTIQLSPHDPQHGFGFFWTDLETATVGASSFSSPHIPPSFPTPDLSTSLLHLTTATPPPIYRLGGPTIRNWMFHLHGVLTSLAFLLLYPLGALLLRTSDPRAFNFHWTTQAFASVLLVLGAMLGWVLSRKIKLVHQYVGLAIVGAVGAQLLLGWRHHMRFLRTKGAGGGDWMGKGHVWIGRLLMVLGLVNVLLGLCARGYGAFTLVVVGLVVLVEGGLMLRVLGLRKGLACFPGLLAKTKGSGRRGRESLREESAGEAGDLGEEHFELVGHHGVDDVEEDEDYDEDGRLKTDVEWEQRMREEEGAGDGERERMRKLKRLDVV